MSRSCPATRRRPSGSAGEFGGKYFVQRITLDLAGRTQQQVAKAWVDQLVTAIRSTDDRHLITVGVIPWVQFFPQAKPLFYSREVAENLDFASVHFYPETGKIDQALTALAVYDIGKPLVIEEMFPLKCSAAELEEFIERSRATAVAGSASTGARRPKNTAGQTRLSDALTLGWLELFQKKASELDL